MKITLKSFLAAVALLPLVTTAAVVYTQPPAGSGLMQSSWWSPNGSDYDQYVWDNFTLSSNVPITEVKWRGGGGAVTGFTIKFYSSITGNSQPDLGSTFASNPLATYTVTGNAGETAAGTFGGVPMNDYDFVLPTPFQATGGTTYWIQIEADQAGIPSWGLATGAGDGTHFLQMAWIGDIYFTFSPGDAAFTLLTADTAIYSVAANANPANGGSITGTGLYPTGMSAALKATPATNFAFVNWTVNGTQVSASPNYSFSVTSNRTLAANFAPGSAISTTAYPASGGSATGGGSYTNGRSITVTATTNANYAFVNWTENGVQVSASKSYTFTVSTNRALVANFTSAVANLVPVYSQPPTIGAYIPSAWWSPDGLDGDSYCFDNFTLTTTQSITGLEWTGGYIHGGTGGSVADFTIKFYSSITGGSQPDVGSVFAANPLKTYTVGGNAFETLSNSQYYYHFTLPTTFTAAAGVTYWVQIEATQTGYLPDWGLAPGTGGDNSHYEQVTGGSTYIGAGDAAFTLLAPAPPAPPIAATIVTSARPANGGKTSGDGGYTNTAPVTVSAVANPGFLFVSWSENGSVVSTNADYQFDASTNRALAANFDPAFTVTLSAAPVGGGSAAGTGIYSALASVSAVATPNPGYSFVNWTEGTTVVSTTTNYDFTLTADRALAANYALIPVSVVAGNSAPGSLACSWNSAANGWVLQESTNLVSWTDSALNIVTNGNQCGVSIPVQSGNKFFRLFRP